MLKDCLKYIFVGLLIACVLESCNSEYTEKKHCRLLEKSSWISTSYINYSINQQITIDTTYYKFFDDGIFYKTRNNDTVYGKWSIYDCNYLNMNEQIFKIAELSNKIMVLRYGNVDFVYYSTE